MTLTFTGIPALTGPATTATWRSAGEDEKENGSALKRAKSTASSTARRIMILSGPLLMARPKIMVLDSVQISIFVHLSLAT
jgi:hypothetical protein